MRGQQSLFNDLFHQEKQKSANRPRNYYQPERNRALIHRYYFHAEINRLRYDDVLQILEKEFYLTEPRIIVILSEQSSNIKKIVHNPPTITDLQKMFPHFNWKSRSL